jgi:hypothetical protein
MTQFKSKLRRNRTLLTLALVLAVVPAVFLALRPETRGRLKKRIQSSQTERKAKTWK